MHAHNANVNNGVGILVKCTGALTTGKESGCNPMPDPSPLFTHPPMAGINNRRISRILLWLINLSGL